MIYSAVNYMGSKRRLLKQILHLFPKNINTFYDLFAGSLIVDLNVKAKNYIINDLSSPMIELFSFLSHLKEQELNTLMLQAASLSNEEIFYKIRTNYNNNPNPRDLFLLITNSFNGIPRWNKSGKYNMPYASQKRLTSSYYHNKETKLRSCVSQLQKMNINMKNTNYNSVIDFSALKENDFVYLDPPYYGTDATYNRESHWDEMQEKQIYCFLEKLLNNNINFAYSNVLTHRNFTNPFLQKFIAEHTNDIKVYHLNISYGNSTYHTKKGNSDEILLTNY